MAESGSDFCLAMIDFMRREGVREQRAAKIVLGAAWIIERALKELGQVSVRIQAALNISDNVENDYRDKDDMSDDKCSSGVKLGHIHPSARGGLVRPQLQGQGEGGRGAADEINTFCSTEVINHSLK